MSEMCRSISGTVHPRSVDQRRGGGPRLREECRIAHEARLAKKG